MLFQRVGDYRFYTKQLFQTTDGGKAKSRMGEVEANLDLKLKRKR